MDLGISGRRAIVCAASKGLGRACAEALAADGAELFVTARTADVLRETAAEISAAHGVAVTPVPGDITTPEGQAAVLDACPNPDILVTNAGGPPPGDFRDWDRDDWVAAVDANMIAPILLIKAVVDGMISRGFGRIVNVTSYSVKMPLHVLGLSNGARAGLTGFIAGLSRETIQHNVTINNLLPGPFGTDRLRSAVAFVAEQQGRDFDEVWIERAQEIPAKRVGDPAEFGTACAFLCSDQAGFITGQNFLIDGGAFPGTM